MALIVIGGIVSFQEKEESFMEQSELVRFKAMQDYLEEDVACLLQERIEKIIKLLKGSEKYIGERFIAALNELISTEEMGVLVVSCLRSSYILGNHEFYLAHYTGDPFVEENPDSIYLDMSALFEPAKEDFEKLDYVLGKNFIRIFPSEKEEIHRWYMEQIYSRFGQVLGLILEKTTKDNGVEVYYGEFMGELFLIGKI